MTALVESVGPYGFWFKAYVIRWIDADTVLVQPQIYKQDDMLRIRIADLYRPERSDPSEMGYREQAEADFPPSPAVGQLGCLIRCKNDHIEKNRDRLVARIDRTT